eukprot:TRINITY_DN112245_c0_g1_i1.p1 TRINITY_DN112245_c0_g1~~TRINITY_DN112245_c0_g1_i1.p1  ORF type:complete len:344 (-),score=63.96 TRINITY_DN112245_c0_g1_i1:78-1109(-)
MPAKGRRRIVFSDIDGTLVHLAPDLVELGSLSADGQAFDTAEGRSLAVRPLPPSSTGVQGYISEETLKLVAQLRRAGHIFVLISGARSSTCMERLPFLPAADAYVMENGGRIFFEAKGAAAVTAAPLVEDFWWRSVHVAAGSASQYALPASQRTGALWDFYRSLEEGGWACDSKSYSTNFRVNLSKSKGKTDADLKRIMNNLPPGLACSFNLGSADFYPATSGKDLAAKYLVGFFGSTTEESVSMGDDDNDLALARIMGHTYIPGFTADSVRAAVAADPSSFTVANVGGFQGTNELLSKIITEFGQFSSGHFFAWQLNSATFFSLAAILLAIYSISQKRRRSN